ncbi:MAG: hypothetical protein R3F61_09530 [Myxococcota bacterium]
MRRVGLLGVICLLACTGGPCAPSMGGYSVTGDVLQRPLHDGEDFVLVTANDPVCTGHPEGAIRFVAEQREGGQVALTLVEANPPSVGRCLDELQISVHRYGDGSGQIPVTPEGASAEVIVAWPESGNAWELSQPLTPPPTAYDGCMRRVDETLMPSGHL